MTPTYAAYRRPTSEQIFISDKTDFKTKAIEREGDKHQCVVVFHVPSLGTWPTSQACALTRNRTGDPLVHRLVLSPLSHTSQDANAVGLDGFLSSLPWEVWFFNLWIQASRYFGNIFFWLSLALFSLQVPFCIFSTVFLSWSDLHLGSHVCNFWILSLLHDNLLWLWRPLRKRGSDFSQRCFLSSVLSTAGLPSGLSPSCPLSGFSFFSYFGDLLL